MGVTSYKILKEQGFADLIKHAGTANNPQSICGKGAYLVKQRFARNKETYAPLIMQHYQSLVKRNVSKIGEVSFDFTKAFELFGKFIP